MIAEAHSDDVCDEEALNNCFEIWNKDCEAHLGDTKHALKEESQYLRQQEHKREKKWASRAAIQYEAALADAYKDDDSFLQWSPNHGLNRQDFDYVFYHRKQFSEEVQTHLEIVASKITHIRGDGEDGYFNKAERNIGWTSYITPLVFSKAGIADNLVRCGLWSNAKNSRRCHKGDFCPLCLWNDNLKVLVSAFGTRSGAFSRASGWFFMTCGFTTNEKNAKCIGKSFEESDFAHEPGQHAYDPYPVCLGLSDDDGDCEWLGCDDARILGLIIQDAFDGLYQSEVLDGYRHKLEGAFQINPGRANRVNFHAHAVGNGRETNVQFIAERLFELLAEGLIKYRDYLSRAYFPDVKVGQITSAYHLERCIIYCEKVVPMSKIFADAMARPEARLADGHWNPTYVSDLEDSLYRLVNDEIPSLFEGFRLQDDVARLRRRKTVGNMTFNDRDTCIGDEPGWHQKLRREKARKLAKKRAEKKKENAESERKAVQPPTKKRKQKHHKNPRRFSRSLCRRLTPQPMPVQREAQTATPLDTG